MIDALGKDGCGISTRRSKLIDVLTIGFYPKPSYEQLGTYKGDMTGYNLGDKVKLTYRKGWSWKDLFKENIISIEKI